MEQGSRVGKRSEQAENNRPPAQINRRVNSALLRQVRYSAPLYLTLHGRTQSATPLRITPSRRSAASLCVNVQVA